MEGAYSEQDAYLIFLRNNKMFKKTLINIKITNKKRNCNSNKLLEVQLLLRELFVFIAVNTCMYGTVKIHEFIYSTSMTSVRAAIHNRALIW